MLIAPSIHMSLIALMLATSLALPINGAMGAENVPGFAATAGLAPKEPRLVFVFESKLKLGELKITGTYDGHKRGTLQLQGGTFDGPDMHGTILPSTHDWPVYYGNGVRLTDVAYSYVTSDGAQLFVRVDGYRYSPADMTGALGEAEKVSPAPNLLRTVIRIQAPDDSKYAWMNYNLFIGVAGTSNATPTDRTATLRVYRIL